MSRTVSFGMYWQCYGRQTIDLPDDIGLTDIEAIKAYIRSVWEDVPIPDGEYVADTDEFDEGSFLDIEADEKVSLANHIIYCNGSLPMGTFRAMLDHLDATYRITLYDEKGTEKGIELESWTDSGVDMPWLVDFRADVDSRCSPYELVRLFREKADEFDIGEEIDIHRQDARYRTDFTIMQSVEDFTAYQNELKTNADALEEILSLAEAQGLTRELCEGVFFSLEDIIDSIGEEVCR